MTYVYQMKSSDVVACIYLGYMPRTQRYVHVHVYRFDGAETASTFSKQMTQMIEANMSRIREVEIDLANKGEIDDPRLTSSDGMSEPHTTDSVESAVGSTSSNCSDEDPRGGGNSRYNIDPDLQSLKDVQPFDNVADELRYRLQLKEAPLLLPPRDYDTISRAHGNLSGVNHRRCLNLDIVGENAVNNITELPRGRNISIESGVDMSSPSSIVGPPEQIEGGPVANIQTPVGHSQNYSPSGSFRSGPSTPGTPPVAADPATGYPFKTATPPMSPQVTNLRRSLHRQGSQSSFKSEGSKQSHHSANVEENDDGNVIIYKGGGSSIGGGVVGGGGAPNGIGMHVGPMGDIYAQPVKRKISPGVVLNNNNTNNNIGIYDNSLTSPMSPKVGAMTSLSPRVDYHGGNVEPEYMNADVQMRHGSGGGHGYSILTRSMPSDLIRSQMVLGSQSARGSRDSRELVQNTDARGNSVRPTSYGYSMQGPHVYNNPYPGQENVYASSGRLHTYR